MGKSPVVFSERERERERERESVLLFYFIVFCWFFFVLGLGIALGLRFLFSSWVAVVDFIDKFSPQPLGLLLDLVASSSTARMVFPGVD